jgi:hypothetical protein
MGIINTGKDYLLRTPFAKSLKNIQAKLTLLRMAPLKSDIELKTVYCISPYKTGTTYLASCFSPEISQHEALLHFSLKYLDRDFDSIFIKRMNYLNLKLECSGFFSAYVNELAKNEIAKNLKYICILRPPSSWVTSVINHWHRPEALASVFEYSNELFWVKRVGVNLHDFQIGVDTKKNQEIVDKLIQFYFDFTKKTRLLNNVTYIELKELDEKLSYVESIIGEPPTIAKKRRKRKAPSKPFIYKNESIDKEYEFLTKKLIEERHLDKAAYLN